MRALVVCRRDGSAALTDDDVRLLDRLLTPDNLESRPPRTHREHGVMSVEFNPRSSVASVGGSFCLGKTAANPSAWNVPGTGRPEGAHALVRIDDEQIELVADAVASRTLWYVLTKDLFVASTSQRAIAALLRSFEPSSASCGWMLSSGSLGPDSGWDARVARVQAGGRVRLERAGWRLAIDEAPIEFSPWTETKRRCTRRLEEAIEAALGNLSFDVDKWVLPLSGGVDSRGLLLLLGERARLRCVTWGAAGSLADPRGDPFIAGRLAARLGVPHRFFPIAISDEPRDRLIERFLVAGEGRTDQLSGYMDGFAIWRTLAEQGYEGVIRGDEAFGWTPVRSEADVRLAVGFPLLADVLDAEALAALDLPPQRIPAALMRREGESLATWRDRAYHQYRVPIVLAALTDLKCAYVEVVNPLLADEIVACTRRLPDRYRTDKRLWTNIVSRRSPPVPFAQRGAVYPLSDFVRDRATLELVLEELGTAAARDLLGSTSAGVLRRGAERLWRTAGQPRRPARRTGVVGRAHGLLAKVARRLPGGRAARRLAPEILAFRAFLAVRACTMLQRDARALAPPA